MNPDYLDDSFRYLVKVNRDTQRCLERHPEPKAKDLFTI